MGVALPDKHLKEFAGLCQAIDSLIPGLSPSSNPHMTIYYLGKQTPADLSLANSAISKHLHLINGNVVTIGGYGLFNNDWPALYLNIQYPTNLTTFRTKLETDLPLSNYGNLPFHPHVAVAKLKMDQLTQAIKNEDELKKIMSPISWCIPLVVNIFGTNPTFQVG